MPQTPIEKIPPHLLRKRGKTYVSIGPESRNVTGFKSRLWNVTSDDRHILVRWGKSGISNNRVAPLYIKYKLHRFNNRDEVDKKLQSLIREKLSSAKGYQRITKGVSLKPVDMQSTFDERPSSTVESKRSRSFTHDVFVSYAHRNKKTVYAMVKELEASKLNIWIDKYDMIENGQPVGVQIQQAIKMAKTVIVMMSRQANESDWVALEATYAKMFRKHIVPCYIQPVSPVGVLSVQLAGTQKVLAYGKHRIGCIQQLSSRLPEG